MNSPSITSAVGSEEELDNKLTVVHLKPRKPIKKTLTIMDKPCEQCGTTSSPLWRKNLHHQHVCNACGIRDKRAQQAKRSRTLSVKVPPVPPVPPRVVNEHLLAAVEEAWKEFQTWPRLVLTPPPIIESGAPIARAPDFLTSAAVSVSCQL